MIFPSGGIPTSAASSTLSASNSGSIGFSFSPGGLLLPYHLGVAECLVYEQFLDPSETIVAGSSAGSIASMAIGCGIDPRVGLEGTIAISDRCLESGRSARGNLLPLLQEQLQLLVGDAEFDFLQQRRSRSRIGIGSVKVGEPNSKPGDAAGTGVVLSYREIFPTQTSHFQTTFETRQDLFRSVGYSCMFPFFTTNFPCLVDFGNGSSNKNSLGLPRLLMDGYFSLPRSHFGCPILQDEFPDTGIDRTVAVTCIPQEIFGMEEIFDQQSSSNSNNIISINGNGETNPLSTADIFRIATQSTSRKELTDLYERGYRDAERWCRREEDNQSQHNIAPNQDNASLLQY
eukprot:jgi/Psemu1/16110/gm1.16110_g